ncbi:hypothetical protein Q3G72_007390 [Acer saccharum]|nr:hypothetical protein Q3G72_007390 [Acer saccharum]
MFVYGWPISSKVASYGWINRRSGAAHYNRRIDAEGFKKIGEVYGKGGSSIHYGSHGFRSYTEVVKAGHRREIKVDENLVFGSEDCKKREENVLCLSWSRQQILGLKKVTPQLVISQSSQSSDDLILLDLDNVNSLALKVNCKISSFGSDSKDNAFEVLKNIDQIYCKDKIALKRFASLRIRKKRNDCQASGRKVCPGCFFKPNLGLGAGGLSFSNKGEGSCH